MQGYKNNDNLRNCTFTIEEYLKLLEVQFKETKQAA